MDVGGLTTMRHGQVVALRDGYVNLHCDGFDRSYEEDRVPFFFFFNDRATPEIYPLSLHDALPICSSVSPSPPSCDDRQVPSPHSSPSCWCSHCSLARSPARGTPTSASSSPPSSAPRCSTCVRIPACSPPAPPSSSHSSGSSSRSRSRPSSSPHPTRKRHALVAVTNATSVVIVNPPSRPICAVIVSDSSRMSSPP